MAHSLVAVALVALGLLLGGCDDRISGQYDEVDGLGSLEFRGDRVYVTMAIVGTTIAADYNVEGDQVIIDGLGLSGSQSLHIRDARTLDGEMGLTFVKR